MRTLFLTLLVFLAPLCAFANSQETQKIQSKKLSNITGDETFGDNQSAWDRTYARKEFVFGKEAASYLKKHLDKLPKGQALDIAIGEGRNAIFLAKKGFIVEGVDISAVGLRKAQNFAVANGVKIETTNADLNKYKIKADFYNVILNFYYLNRSLFPQIKAGLKKGGVVVFEANTVEQKKLGGAASIDNSTLLQPGELKAAFADFEILDYSETNDGKYAVASLVARKK
jgi:2-polyprenyl-3-methyl-5-hydroxy-6-metoxy-1,4-benzoquinol methylase